MAVMVENGEMVAIQEREIGLYFTDGVLCVTEYGYDVAYFSKEDTLALYNKMKVHYGC